MKNGRFAILAATVCGLTVVDSSVAQAQTQAFLQAPRVRSYVRVQADGKELRFVLDNKNQQDPLGEVMPKDQLLLASPSEAIKVLYAHFNPLKVQVTVGVTTTDDPSQTAISQLISTILAIPSIVRPGTGNAKVSAYALIPGCSQIMDAEALLSTLRTTLYADLQLAKQVKSWTDTIDAALDVQGGFKGVSDAKAAMGEFLNKKDEGLTDRIAAARAAISKVEAALASNASPVTSCEQIAKDIYEGIALANPKSRLTSLSLLQTAIQNLAKSLEAFTDPQRWVDKSYFVVTKDGIRSTPDKVQVVTIKVSSVVLTVPSTDDSVTLQTADQASGVFDLRAYGRFTAEIGVGVTFATQRRLKYGTTVNADGKTVVSQPVPATVDIQPTIMINFVCRCQLSALEPMLQVGASASQDTPSIFVGGGIRLFAMPGKGDVALGYGLTITWTKDLKTLKPGDVAGTADIQADLAFVSQPRFGQYFGIQYKF